MLLCSIRRIGVFRLPPPPFFFFLAGFLYVTTLAVLKLTEICLLCLLSAGLKVCTSTPWLSLLLYLDLRPWTDPYGCLVTKPDFFKHYIYLLFACAFDTAHAWRSEDNSLESFPSLRHVEPRNLIQFIILEASTFSQWATSLASDITRSFYTMDWDILWISSFHCNFRTLF